MKKTLLIILLFMCPQVVFARSAAVDITTMSISEIQEAVDLGIINYEILVEVYLDRIDTYNDKYNAISFINENAITLAKELDIEYKETGRRGPLHGIPIIIKDNIDVVGFPTNASSRILANNYPQKNAALVQKLLDAGAIVIAKGRMSEFAFSASNSFNSYGNVYNAFDNKYTPYGSSGGVSVAVALSFAQLGIGTDTNSSIRTPSAASNLIGLRPTLGLIDSSGIIPYDSIRDTAGPITKYATDAAIVMSIINNEKSEYKLEQKTDLSEYKFGFLTELYDAYSTKSDRFAKVTDKEITKLMDELYNKFNEYNAKTKLLDNFYNSSMFSIPTSTYTGILFCYDFNQYIKGTTGPVTDYSDMLNGGTVQDLEYYNEYCETDYRNTAEYKTKEKQKQKFKDYIINYMEENEIDFLVYPTTKNLIPTISSKEAVSSLSPLISPVTGMPSINLQLGFIEGLPYGFEILGRENSEEDLLQIAAYYDTKTKSYQGIENAKSLYVIADNVVELLELHNKYYSNKLYTHLTEKSSYIFLNLDNDNDIDKTIDEYKTYRPPVVDIVIDKFKTDSFLMIAITFAIVLTLLIIYNYLKLLKARKKIFSKKR